MAKQTRYLYEFGPFRLDPTERMLTRGDEVLSLTPKAMETLLALVENSRHVVAKEELMNRVWPDIYVEETNLAQHISMLRKVLGERPDGGQYIETVPKRGYRFVIPVKKIRYEPSELKTRVSGFGAQAKDSAQARKGRADTIVPSARRTGEEKSASVGPGTKLGRYEIISRLGAGGMGEVYLAHDTQLDRKVALKLLSEKFTENAEWLRRFYREAKAASSLNHPNIITIHEIGQQDGIHYIAAEYIEGQTLRLSLAKGRMKVAGAINVAAQMASALAAAHAAGVVHRDIKPENVMLRPDGFIKILDFGLAKFIEPKRDEITGKLSQLNTDPGVVMGTVNYMSPEQARGLALDTRSDIFSLGVTLYEMLTGRAPFEGETTSDIIVAILDREPQRLSQSLGDISAELERIVAKSLRKDREERYQTVKDFQLDLKSLQQELELQAKLGEASRRASQEQPSAYATAVARRHSIDRELFDIPEVHYARSGDVTSLIRS